MTLRNIKNIGYKVVRLVPPSVRSPFIRWGQQFGNWYSKTAGQWQGNAVAAYWYRGRINFGDLLTPALLKFYGFSPCFSNSPCQGVGNVCDIVAVGSILEHVHHEFQGIILGSGAMFDEPRELPNALFLAVRGELTKQLYQCSDSVTLGDPGLLANRLCVPNIPKKYRLGIVIHYIERDAGLVEGKFGFGVGTKLIDPRCYPGDVILDISECEYIASSSLHGLIIADSLGIPCVRISLSEGLLSGGDFKFNDYYSSIGIQHEKLFVAEKVTSDHLIDLTNTPPKDIILQRKNDLHELFVGLKTILEKRKR